MDERFKRLEDSPTFRAATVEMREAISRTLKATHEMLADYEPPEHPSARTLMLLPTEEARLIYLRQFKRPA